MEIDKKKAKFSTVKNGKKYFFCSKNCHDKFIKGDGRAEEKGKPQPISATKKTTIPISGMHCASCANNIEMALSKQKGVSKASLNFATEKATVEFDDKLTDENSLKEIIRKTGYKVVGQEKAQEKSGQACPGIAASLAVSANEIPQRPAGSKVNKWWFFKDAAYY